MHCITLRMGGILRPINTMVLMGRTRSSTRHPPSTVRRPSAARCPPGGPHMAPLSVRRPPSAVHPSAIHCHRLQLLSLYVDRRTTATLSVIQCTEGEGGPSIYAQRRFSIAVRMRKQDLRKRQRQRESILSFSLSLSFLLPFSLRSFFPILIASEFLRCR